MSITLSKADGVVPMEGVRKLAIGASWDTTAGTSGGVLGWGKRKRGTDLDAIAILTSAGDPVRYAGLDVLDNLGAEERELRAIQQQAYPELGPVRRRERPWIDPQRRDCGLATVGTADFWRPGFAEDMHGNVKAGAGNHPYSASRRPIIGLTILPEASF